MKIFPIDGPSALFYAPAGTTNCEIQVCRSAEDLNALALGWLRLESEAESGSVFTSLAWAKQALRHFAAEAEASGGKAAREVVIATVSRDGALLALWPLAVRRRGRMRVLVSIAAPFDQNSEVLVRRGEDAAALIAAMAEELRTATHADGFILRKVKTSGAVFAALSARSVIIDEGAAAPQIRLDPRAPFSAFLETINAKTRKNLRNYRNRLGRLGTVRHEVIRGQALQDVIARSFAGRQAWLSDNGLSSEAFRDPGFQKFVAALAGETSELQLVGFALSLTPPDAETETETETVALQWGMVHGRTYYAFMSSRNPKFEDYSAGRIHLQHVIEACHADGLDHLDLMVPATAYKMTWTDAVEPVVDLVLPWSLRGRVSLSGYDAHVRPALKRFVAALPAPVRKLVLRSVRA